MVVNNLESFCSFKNESGLGTILYPFITELRARSLLNEQLLVLETSASQPSLKELLVCQGRQQFEEKFPNWFKTLY